MRVLVASLMLCANMAGAEPDCAESPLAHPSHLLAYEPVGGAAMLPGEASATVAAAPWQEVVISPRPALRPCKFRNFALGRERMRQRGAVCGDWTILGETLKSFSGKYRGCGIADPVRVRRVSDVYLSQLALMDCMTAVTLKTWIETTAKPAFADQGGGLKGLRLAGHYSCRTQNNLPRARISEHARGRAIDISAFVLWDGTEITVGNGWNAEDSGDVLRKLHAGACGLFGTVLGPNSDRFHKGHFHFDTARRRSGPLCR
ncbi:extensin family protein [Ruegeria sediminis]|uniref:Extensin family protein n=1 Tax=Ruegeria sediminis TaxID=2583820 RepID=A0ABY2X3U1_9RHOB|nr:extensin family protein [Ruegeria sediminis]TMV10056.1 extensin family protein [Ruegeria sediminis]